MDSPHGMVQKLQKIVEKRWVSLQACISDLQVAIRMLKAKHIRSAEGRRVAPAVGAKRP